MYTRATVLSCFYFMLCISGNVCSKDVPSAEYVREQLSIHHKSLLNAHSNCEAKFTQKHFAAAEHGDSGPLRKSHETAGTVCIDIAAQLILTERRRSDAADIRGITLKNSRYGAVIDSGLSGTYSLGALSVEPWPEDMQLFKTGSLPRELATGYTFYGFEALDLFSAPFVFEKAEWVQVGSTSCLQTDWVWNAAAVQGIRLEVTFSPEEDWAIRSFNELHPKGRAHWDVTYQQFSNSYFPKRILKENFSPDGKKVVSRRETVFDIPTPFETPEDQFYLRFYGLPEPKSVNRPNFLLYGIAIFSAFGIAGLAWWRRPSSR